MSFATQATHIDWETEQKRGRSCQTCKKKCLSVPRKACAWWEPKNAKRREVTHG